MSKDQRTVRGTKQAVAASAIAVMLLTTGCGAIADRAMETVVEEGLEKGIEVAIEADTGEEFELDLDLDEGSVDFQSGDAEGSFGANLDRPDWLDDSYELPPGLMMTQQVDDDAGVQQIGGLIQGETKENLAAQQLETLGNMGFDVAEQFVALGADSGLATHSDGRAVEFLLFGEDNEVVFTVIFHDAGTSGADSVVSRIETLRVQAEDAA